MIRVGDLFYRYEDYRVTPPVNEYDEPSSHEVHIRLLKLKVTGITTKSVVLDYFGDKKRISLTARTPWACATKEEALRIYRKRKKAQLKLLLEQVSDVQRIVNKINGGQLSDIEDIEELEA